jgi:D-alanyl-lipoteichoic acid acyltransferase DltB (MBOAT superfamily)
MLFNSFHFLVFFPIIVILYFAIPFKWRKHLLLAASWYFYMSWKAEYIFLIIFSTSIDYFAAIQIRQAKSNLKKKQFLYLSLIVNLGTLFAFKYFNFFNENISGIFQQFNIFYDSATYKLLLPVGISFYTFQSMSYTIDVYRKKIKVEQSFVKFALYVSFFPQLVAGPIERAANLLPQFDINHKFNYERVSKGLKLMFWGFFQKLVIADNMARFVDVVYANPENYYGWDIALVTFLFAIQIYADFSGYTDIARGAAKIMGYNLMLNFKRPYFATSVKEFWKRWHISLSTWFKDYVYISLGGNRKAKFQWFYAIVITFILSGLWHGANWTFILWGFYHALIYLMERTFDKKDFRIDKNNRITNIFKALFVFIAIVFGWMIFRANSIADLGILLNHLFSKALFAPKLSFDHVSMLVNFLAILILLAVWLIEREKNIVEYVSGKPFWQRWTIYFVAMLCIIGFGNWGMEPFIYFRF